MTVTELPGGSPALVGMNPSQLSTLNALVTATMERLDNELNGATIAERDVAKIVGAWCLSGAGVGPYKNIDPSTPMGAAITRDRSLADLANRVTRFFDEDNTPTEEVESTIDAYITDAMRQRRRLRTEGADDVTTRLVHCEGGIDALQDIRERLLGRRLDLQAFDQPPAL